MARATKAELDKHEEAEQLIFGTDRQLTIDETDFVYDNWLPYVATRVDVSGAFFTPYPIAMVLAQHTAQEGRVVDLCAGTGILIWAMLCRAGWGRPDYSSFEGFVAVEFSETYVTVGKRLLPEVEWITGDVFDIDLLYKIGRFDHAVTNPPFGRVRANKGKASWLKYQGDNALMVVEVGLRIADTLVAILPQNILPYECQRGYGCTQWRGHYDYKSCTFMPRKEYAPKECQQFTNVYPSAYFYHSSQDLAEVGEWKGANPRVEIVSVEFDPVNRRLPSPQMSLFET